MCFLVGPGFRPFFLGAFMLLVDDLGFEHYYRDSSIFWDYFGGVMAMPKELSVLELQWIKKSLEFQRAGLVRSKAKEMPGSDISVLRGKEIAALDALINKFS